LGEEFMEEKENIFSKDNPGWRPSFSIAVGVGWLVFLIVWFAFYASDYAWEKNIAILLLSILIAFVLLGGVWAAWGIKRIPKEGREMFKTLGFKWRVQVSIVLPLAAMIFLIVWFWYYAIPYTIWQNIAILLVTLLVVGGIVGVIWAKWGMMHGHKFDKHAAAAYYHHEKKEEEDDEDIGKKVDEELDK
jgi:hypothetical protein